MSETPEKRRARLQRELADLDARESSPVGESSVFAEMLEQLDAEPAEGGAAACLLAASQACRPSCVVSAPRGRYVRAVSEMDERSIPHAEGSRRQIRKRKCEFSSYLSG